MATPITVLHTITARRALTPIGRRIRLADGTLAAAYSADMAWTYERDMDLTGSPWFVTHRPSGHVEILGNLNDARAWTALPNVADLMRYRALERLETAPGPMRVRLIRALTIYSRELVPAGANVEAVAQCGCGGVLVEVGPELRHWDVCDTCRTDPAACSLEQRYRHTVCQHPAAAQCGHGPCRGASQGIEPCEDDLACCRGGHHGDADLAE